ncbi:MAG: YggT family protein [Actinobacteria bacterium]|nr:MAG: YggT family protein [Actinomycetota bacterium]
MDVICALLLAFIVVLFARAVLSWFPIRPGTPMATISLVLSDLTEWALRPLRRVIPPVGMFDLSFLVLTFGLLILRQAIC